MKTSSLLYFLATVLAILGAVLRISHVIDKYAFYALFGVSLALGIWGNELRRREVK
ncbi:hypothetical protein [Rufibacter tibetensis]|uniref:hypothetical protein n=1 Tax=Rufibacter tibetensis TaxID=512763 RepID=UPI000ACBBF1F|nr:hypothetical protein [Rufibacter tibetensis]